uniref:Uncharacterized protein n=1 Tax=Varanus komodoensis TaxID=61221 RepID=A0A8D2L946_VARKO
GLKGKGVLGRGRLSVCPPCSWEGAGGAPRASRGARKRRHASRARLGGGAAARRRPPGLSRGQAHPLPAPFRGAAGQPRAVWSHPRGQQGVANPSRYQIADPSLCSSPVDPAFSPRPTLPSF